MDPVTRELLAEGAKFEIFSTQLLKSSKSPDGKMRLHGVASSTVKDLHGDVIEKSALDDMVQKANSGLTIFLNHSYYVPEDVAGSVEKAAITQQGSDESGTPIYDLAFDIVINGTNQRAIDTWTSVNAGAQLGISIGALIPEDGAKRQKDGSYTIQHLLLLEASIVGIPANPRSWVEYAAKALRRKAHTTTLGNPTLTLDGDRYKIEGSIGDLDLSRTLSVGQVETAQVDGELVTVCESCQAMVKGGMPDGLCPSCGSTGPFVGKFLAAATCPDCGGSAGSPKGGCANAMHKASGDYSHNDTHAHEHDHDHGHEDGSEHGHPHSHVHRHDHGHGADSGHDGPEHDAQGTAAHNHDHSGSSNSHAHDSSMGGGPRDNNPGDDGDQDDQNEDRSSGKSVEPDVAAAKIRIIEVDTDDPSSGDSSAQAPSSGDVGEPGAADGGDAVLDSVQVAKAEDELVQLSFNQLRALALRLTTELVEARTALGAERERVLAIEKERDSAISTAAELIRRAGAVIEQVGDLPLARKAILKDLKAELSSSIEAYYGTEFAKALGPIPR